MHKVGFKCQICGSEFVNGNRGMLLNRDVQYLECQNCLFVRTEEPKWLGEAYANPINITDTGILARNLKNCRVTVLTLLLLGGLKKTVIDYAGGYGILVRLLRDAGINALWQDKYCENILSKGFEYKKENAVLVTAFEVFEHFVNPTVELENLLLVAKNILISTEIMPIPTPSIDSWWYYGVDHGQHISFYRIKTLERMARENKLFFISDGYTYHLFSEQPVNKIIWKFFIKINKILYFLISKNIKSKILSDQKYLKNNIK